MANELFNTAEEETESGPSLLEEASRVGQTLLSGTTTSPEASGLFQRAKQVQQIRNTPIVGLGSMPGEKTSIAEGLARISPEPDPVRVDHNMSTILTPGWADDVTHHDVVDFLFGGEMAILGMKYDTSGFFWDWEIAKQQWSEEPLWINLLNATSLVGTALFPVGRAVWASQKFGKLATAGLRAKGITKADEIKKYKELGIIDADDVSDKTIKLARMQEHYRSSFERLAARQDAFEAGGDMGRMERWKFEFQKRFANTYYKIANPIADPDSPALRDRFYKNLDELFKAEKLGDVFVGMPEGEEAGKRVYQYWLRRLNPSLTGRQIQLSAQERKWGDTLYDMMRDQQQKNFDLGLIDAPTLKHVGDVHIPALYKDTDAIDVATTRTYFIPLATKEGVSFKAFSMPRMDSPTLKARKKELPDVYNRLVNDELITSPDKLTMYGLVMDKLLYNNYKIVRDIATDDKFSISASTAINMFKSRKAAEKAGYISLDTLNGSIPGRLKKIIEKHNPSFLSPDGALPYVRKEVFDDLFGESGIFMQTSNIGNMLDLLTTVHKVTATGLNIPTQFQNLASNIAFLSQAGFNFSDPTNLKIAQKAGQSFERIAKHLADQRALGKTPSLDSVSINLGTIKVGNKTLDLNEFLDPQVRELIEESAFESVEGFANINRMLSQFSKQQYTTRATAKAILKLKSFAQVGDRVKWFDFMTKQYLAEDMIPKMTYYMGLRAQGMTKEAAILEVGRRLPMYSTVGSSVKQGRKWLFPWASFPAEAVRITKNNMMDRPLLMLPWLQAPNILQSVISGVEAGPSASEIEEAKRQLPFWAQTGTTVVGEAETGATIGGGATGALLGSVIGTRLGGAGGAMAGAAIGGAAGAAALKAITPDEDNDKLRGAVIDWLPHASFFITTTSPDFGGEVLPFRGVREAIEQMPAEPLGILKPIADILSGRTGWGQDIQGASVGEEFERALSQTVGFLAPPFIQRYGFRTTTPDVSLTQALIGTDVPGDITNISRLATETGLAIDPMTGKPGNFSNDFLLKSFSMWKSWAADPAIQLANEELAERDFSSMRNVLSKNLAYHLENSNEDQAVKILQAVMSSFSKQYVSNPAKAQEKYNEWLKRRARDVGRHPRLRGMSEEEIVEKLNEVSLFSASERSKARDEMVKLLQQQLRIRQSARGGSRSPGIMSTPGAMKTPGIFR